MEEGSNGVSASLLRLDLDGDKETDLDGKVVDSELGGYGVMGSLTREREGGSVCSSVGMGCSRRSSRGGGSGQCSSMLPLGHSKGMKNEEPVLRFMAL